MSEEAGHYASILPCLAHFSAFRDPDITAAGRVPFAFRAYMTCYAAANDPHERCNDSELKTQPGCFARLLSDRTLAKDSAGPVRRRPPTA